MLLKVGAGAGTAFGLVAPLNAVVTHRPLSSSFLGLAYRILDIKHKQELLRGLWVLQLRIGRGLEVSERPWELQV